MSARQRPLPGYSPTCKLKNMKAAVTSIRRTGRNRSDLHDPYESYGHAVMPLQQLWSKFCICSYEQPPLTSPRLDSPRKKLSGMLVPDSFSYLMQIDDQLGGMRTRFTRSQADRCRAGGRKPKTEGAINGDVGSYIEGEPGSGGNRWRGRQGAAHSRGVVGSNGGFSPSIVCHCFGGDPRGGSTVGIDQQTNPADQMSTRT
jgi:hypothetical protein